MVLSSHQSSLSQPFTASKGKLIFEILAYLISKFIFINFIRVPPTSLIVRLGEQRVGMMDEPLPHYEIPVSAVVGHPNFEEGSLFNDIAVLMLSSPAPSGLSYISPICLPSSSYEQLPNQCVVTGWGHDTLSGNY